MSTLPNDAAIEALREDLAILRNDVSTLVEHFRNNVTTELGSATKELNANARDAYSAAAAAGQDSGRLLIRQVEEHPVFAAAMVLGVAYLGGRLLARS
ncbi:MAG: hypothetical protein RIR97_256 [Pseudomonadota bacterium]|jgi:hypothetical protein